jgi:hypothetical protein
VKFILFFSILLLSLPSLASVDTSGFRTHPEKANKKSCVSIFFAANLSQTSNTTQLPNLKTIRLTKAEISLNPTLAIYTPAGFETGFGKFIIKRGSVSDSKLQTNNIVLTAEHVITRGSSYVNKEDSQDLGSWILKEGQKSVLRYENLSPEVYLILRNAEVLQVKNNNGKLMWRLSLRSTDNVPISKDLAFLVYNHIADIFAVIAKNDHYRKGTIEDSYWGEFIEHFPDMLTALRAIQGEIVSEHNSNQDFLKIKTEGDEVYLNAVNQDLNSENPFRLYANDSLQIDSSN